VSAPFRDLFVELPRAVFEVLQGIGERAASDGLAQMHRDLYPARREPRLLTFLRNAEMRRLLAERYGWREIGEPALAVADDGVDLVIRRACGHRSRVRLDGRIFDELRPRAAIDELDRHLFRFHERGRRCYCVPRPGCR
jgi:hypothetical protein